MFKSIFIVFILFFSITGFAQNDRVEFNLRKKKVLEKYGPSKKIEEKNKRVLEKYNAISIFGSFAKKKNKKFVARRRKVYGGGIKKFANINRTSKRNNKIGPQKTVRRPSSAKEKTISQVFADAEKNPNEYSVLDGGQINGKEVDLFKIISRRYILSGLKRLEK